MREQKKLSGRCRMDRRSPPEENRERQQDIPKGLERAERMDETVERPEDAAPEAHAACGELIAREVFKGHGR